MFVFVCVCVCGVGGGGVNKTKFGILALPTLYIVLKITLARILIQMSTTKMY